MGRLTFWVILLIALFSGYWFVAAQATQSAVQNAISDARNDGWQIDTGDLTVTGFPGAFDVQIADPGLVSPDGQISWSGPALHATAPSLSPTRLSLIFPQTQTLRLPGQTIHIETTRLVARAATRLNMAFDFEAASLAIVEAIIRSDAGWQVALASADAGLAAVEGELATYAVDIALVDLALPASLMRELASDSRLISLTADAKVTLDRALDRFVSNGPPPALTRIDLASFSLIWGDVLVNAKGALDIDIAGVPEGRIVLKSAQWQAMLDILVAAGLLDADIAPTLSNVAKTMAGGDGVLELPITFRGGFMSMGLLPLGPAPRLH